MRNGCGGSTAPPQPKSRRSRASEQITADALPRSRALGAELVHAVRNEWAVTLLDILQRRCMIGLRADFGLQAAPAAADWLCRLGLWDRARAAQEVADYREYARRSRARDVQQVT